MRKVTRFMLGRSRLGYVVSARDSPNYDEKQCAHCDLFNAGNKLSATSEIRIIRRFPRDKSIAVSFTQSYRGTSCERISFQSWCFYVRILQKRRFSLRNPFEIQNFF